MKYLPSVLSLNIFFPKKKKKKKKKTQPLPLFFLPGKYLVNLFIRFKIGKKFKIVERKQGTRAGCDLPTGQRARNRPRGI